MTFPLRNQDWYLKRDDRTRRVDGVAGFEEFKVGIIVSDELGNDFQCQIMTWLMGNVLARWCRYITIQVPQDVKSELNLSKGDNFSDSIQRALLNIDPYLALKIDQVDENAMDAVCVIGNHKGQFSKKAIWIDSDSWLTGIGTYPRKKYHGRIKSENILGASFAACLGCAELFRRATTKEAIEDQEVWYSLWDFKKSVSKSELRNPPYINNWEFGHAHQPGCGAVGSSFDYLLALTNWSGSIDLIDFDAVTYSNCNRSLGFTAYQAVHGIAKVDACAEILNFNPAIRSRKFLCDYSQYIGQCNFLAPPPDLIFCLANQGTIWADIQHNLPPIVVHATTTPNWGVNVGRHIPKKEWCILCRFSDEVKRLHSFTPECGKGTEVYENRATPILGVLPFLSPMAAILLLAEMSKMALSNYPVNANFVDFSLMTSIGKFITTMGQINGDCVCRRQEMDTYAEPIKETRYWHLVSR
jgi:hypothetical protein